MKKSVAFLVTIFLCLWGNSGFCAVVSAQPEKVKLQVEYGSLPLAFIKKQGQVDEKVLYYLKGREGTIYFTKSGIVYDLVKKQKSDVGAQRAVPNDPASNIQDQTISRLSFTLKPQGANADVQVIPQDELAGKVNYFIGNDSAKWNTNISTYKSVIYQNLYPGIDLKVYGTNQQMEYDFIVHPGADPNNISLAGEGIDGLEVDAEGNLIIKTALTDIKHLKPIIYQEINGQRITVDGSFTTTQNRIGFDIQNYNRDYPLTIDPLTLSYSTYLGGGGNDYGYGIRVDNSGCAYVTGSTASSNFPTANGYDPSYNSNTDVFITKLSSSGNAFSYSTYLGGSSTEVGYGIAIDTSGCAYVTGYTSSSNFPTANPYDATKASGKDVFITKLNASGNGLSYSTYLGGGGDDYGKGITVDNSGCAYVSGYTGSSSFPTVNPYDSSYNSNTDAFVTKFTASGNALSYSTFLGGSSNDYGYGIAVGGNGCAYVTGYTASSNFPKVNAFQSTLKAIDAFVTKFTAAGNALSYSTYLGGSAQEFGNGIAVDSQGCAYITGYTASAWGYWATDFPVVNAFQGTCGGGVGYVSDAFVSKFTAAGTALFYSTYLGGGGNDIAFGIAVDSQGCAYVSGRVCYSVPGSDFPLFNAYQGTFGGGTNLISDAFITKFTAAGNALSYSTYLGGSGDDVGNGIAVDTGGNAYVTGYTGSSNFPTSNPYQGTMSGNTDAFITKLTFGTPPVAEFSGTPTSGYATLTVTFTDQSTNNPTSWTWDFGDTGTSDLQNPTHEYTTPGTHTVSLTASNACGNDTETKTGYIIVSSQSPVQYFYDDVGRLIKVQDDQDTVIEYTYDSNGNRQSKVITIP